MRLDARLIAVVLVGGGCAHLQPRTPTFDCVSEVITPERDVRTTRVLDRNGRQLRAETWWDEKAVKPKGVWIGAAWFGGTDDPDLSSNHLVLSFAQSDPEFPKWLGAVELRQGTPSNPATDHQLINRNRVNMGVYPSWPTVSRLLASGAPLYLVEVDRSGRTHRAELISATMIRDALVAAKSSIDVSRTLAADPMHRCAPHEETIVT